MKRHLTTAAVVAALSLAVSSCGTGSGGSAPAEGGAADGGAATSGADGGGDGPRVAFVPKLQGVPYFEAMNTGGQAACEELGCEWLYQGPVEADAAAQSDIVRSFIQQGVDVLVVAPNDPDSIAPLMQQAADAGIAVATADTDAPGSAREVFVEQASTQGIGEGLTDALMDATGGSGQYAIVSCGETAQNLNSWIEVQRAYTAEAYPDAEIVDVVYAGEDQARATQLATDLMNANPDLTGLVGECTSSAPGVAQAVRDAGRVGEVSTVGLGTPQSMLPYLEDGSSSAAILWDVEALGHLTAYAGTQLAAGEGFDDLSSITDTYPDVTYDEGTQTLLLGPPLQITADNAGDYDY